jgi:hypothetical protein
MIQSRPRPAAVDPGRPAPRPACRPKLWREVRPVGQHLGDRRGRCRPPRRRPCGASASRARELKAMPPTTSATRNPRWRPARSSRRGAAAGPVRRVAPAATPAVGRGRAHRDQVSNQGWRERTRRQRTPVHPRRRA